MGCSIEERTLIGKLKFYVREQKDIQGRGFEGGVTGGICAGTWFLMRFSTSLLWALLRMLLLLSSLLRNLGSKEVSEEKTLKRYQRIPLL